MLVSHEYRADINQSVQAVLMWERLVDAAKVVEARKTGRSRQVGRVGCLGTRWPSGQVGYSRVEPVLCSGFVEWAAVGSSFKFTDLHGFPKTVTVIS